MRIPLSQLYEMTEYEFNLYRIGHQKQEIEEWKRTRFVAWITQAIHGTKEHPALSIYDVMPLPGDEESKKLQTEYQKKISKLKPVAKVSQKKIDDVFARLGLTKPE